MDNTNTLSNVIPLNPNVITNFIPEVNIGSKLIELHTNPQDNVTQSYSPNGSTNFLLHLTEVIPPLKVNKFFKALQKWEGYVTEVRRYTIKVILHPIIGEGPDQEAEIYNKEIAPDDRPLVKSGAFFYWSIGYHFESGNMTNASIIRFRRLPNWEKEELESASIEAVKMRNILNDK